MCVCGGERKEVRNKYTRNKRREKDKRNKEIKKGKKKEGKTKEGKEKVLISESTKKERKVEHEWKKEQLFGELLNIRIK